MGVAVEVVIGVLLVAYITSPLTYDFFVVGLPILLVDLGGWGLASSLHNSKLKFINRESVNSSSSLVVCPRRRSSRHPRLLGDPPSSPLWAIPSSLPSSPRLSSTLSSPIRVSLLRVC